MLLEPKKGPPPRVASDLQASAKEEWETKAVALALPQPIQTSLKAAGNLRSADLPF